MRRLPLVLSIALALVPASAQAASVSGTVAGGQGYTVLALSPSGQATSAKVAGKGAFSLRLPGKGATLQLVKPNGAYFGPVVLRKAGKKALLTLSANGGKLGRIALKAGYAAARAPKRSVSPKGAIRTKHGAPYGAGNLGFVKMTSRKARSAAAGDGVAGADPDGDGVPSTFDADDNGNKTFDGVDPQTARTSTAGLFSDVQVMMARSVNANAGGISLAAADEFVKSNTSLNFYLDPQLARGSEITHVDVDCGTLAYCRPGDGYATMGDGGNSPTGVQNQPWISLDDNHDGFPDVPVNTNGDQSHGTIHSIEIKPNATTADLHAGDLYQVRFTTPGGVVTVPTALSLYFVSSPALHVYDAGAGPVAITYNGQATPGSDQNPLMLSGDKLTMTFWRPQRAGLGGEPDFVDMGHLRYGIPLNANGRELGCADRYTGLSSTLSTAPGTSDSIYNQLFPLQDNADDAAPNAGNTLKFTFDLGGCLHANGVDTSQPIRLPLQAVDESRPGGTDRTGQTIAVCLPGCTPPAQNGGQGNGTGPQGGGGGGEAGGKPDLAVDGVTGTDNGGGCDLVVNIANRGTAMSSPTPVAIQVSGGGASSFQAQSIPAGGHGTATGSIAGACGGQTLTATVDPSNAVDEYAENNNSWTGTL
jgi:hypothetical protein